MERLFFLRVFVFRDRSYEIWNNVSKEEEGTRLVQLTMMKAENLDRKMMESENDGTTLRYWIGCQYRVWVWPKISS